MKIEVLLSVQPRTIVSRDFELTDGITLHELLSREELWQWVKNHELDMRDLKVACWGHKVSSQQLLQSGDRIELCRPLRVDPKVARRERFEKQGKRGAGLFSLAGKKKINP